MQIKQVENTYFVRLEVGEEILTSLNTLCETEDIRLAFVQAIGAVEYAVCGLYDVAEQQYHSTRLQGPLEMVSLTGNITRKEGAPYMHLHAAFSNHACQVFGGHLNEAVISATCELIVTCLPGEITRRVCEKTGLNIWQM